MTSISDVSLVIPVHNEENTLMRVLDSIAIQNVKQIVVVLDRCTDDSEKIVNSYSKKNKKIEINTTSIIILSTNKNFVFFLFNVFKLFILIFNF